MLAGATHAATPELVPTQVNASCSTAEVAHEDNTHGTAHVDAPLFNIFRPAKDRKVCCVLLTKRPLVFVTHGPMAGSSRDGALATF
eukprot:1150842-Pelagomonas_calceolata.AAC.7